MALPVTISSVTFPSTSSGNLGPFLYGSAVYVVVRDASGYPTVYKGTDPTTSFSEQDATNNPTVAAAAHMSSHFDGTFIHVMWVVTTTVVTHYARFNCSTDSWVDASTYGGTASTYYRTIYTPTIAPVTNPYWGSLTTRSDGDVIIFHPGENAQSKGGEDQAAAYSRLEGTSLTAGVAVASPTAKNEEYAYGYVIMGSSDQCHFGYWNTASADFYLTALDSTNNLRTQRTSAGTYTGVTGGTNYTRSATETIAFQVHNGATQYRISFPHFTDDSSPTFTTQTITSSADSTYTFDTSSLIHDAAANNENNYAAYIASADGDVYLMGDGGGGTWTDQNSSTAIRAGTVQGVSGNIFDRNGNMNYAFLYNDAGTVKYDEFVLYSTADNLGIPPDVTSNSEVDTPTITQIQNLTVTEITSNSEVDAPLMVQIHDLAVTEITSNSEVDTPLLTFVWNLAVTEITSNSEVDTPTITQIHNLTATEIQSASEVETPTGGYVFAATEIQSLTEVETPTGGYVFAATEITSNSEVDTPVMVFIATLTVVEITSNSEVDTPAITQLHNLTSTEISSNSEVDTPILGHIYVFFSTEIQSASEVDTTSISQLHNLLVTEISSNTEVDTPAVFHLYNLPGLNYVTANIIYSISATNDISEYYTLQVPNTNCMVVLFSFESDDIVASPGKTYTVTYGAGTFTEADPYDPPDNGFSSLVHYLLTPASGNNLLRIQTNDSFKNITATVLELRGVDEADPIGNTETASSTTVAITSETSNAITLSVLGMKESGQGGVTPSTDNTELVDYQGGGN